MIDILSRSQLCKWHKMFKIDCGERATGQFKIKTALKTGQVPTNNFLDLRNVNFWQRLKLYIGRKKNPFEFFFGTKQYLT